jgi:hypothetical protein
LGIFEGGRSFGIGDVVCALREREFGFCGKVS